MAQALALAAQPTARPAERLGAVWLRAVWQTAVRDRRTAAAPSARQRPPSVAGIPATPGADRDATRLAANLDATAAARALLARTIDMLA